MCSVPSCTDLVKARGWCGKHYQRWKQHGDPLITLNSRDMSVEERLRLRMAVGGSAPEGMPWLGPCWIWVGARTTDGYGVFWFQGKNRRAHRVSYLVHMGFLANGFELDHLCRNRACCNPAHLQPVTRRVNNDRGSSPSAVNARKTHCPRNHPYNEINTMINSQGRRVCRVCAREASRRWYARSRQQQEER